jgi:hypothetical protein
MKASHPKNMDSIPVLRVRSEGILRTARHTYKKGAERVCDDTMTTGQHFGDLHTEKIKESN